MTFTNKKSQAVKYDGRIHELRFAGQDLLQSLGHRTEGTVVARLRGSKDLVEWVALDTIPNVSNTQVLACADAVLSGDIEPLPIEALSVSQAALPSDWTITRSEIERAKRRILRRIGRKLRKACRRKNRLVVEK